MIGKTISHYEILEKLGEGGMGVVYKARDTKLDRTVALKFLPPHLGSDDTEKQRFLNEAKAASALDHTNICSIYSIEETDDGNLFIVMAYYEGMSLKERIEQGPLPIKDVVNYAHQIASGLQKAHEKGVVHRDLKPANIFITNDEQIKIIDFGLAKAAQRTMLTQSGTTLGTVPYMSPEQAQGSTVDHRTDIWSLGVVMYEMVTGQLPFKSEYDTALIYSIVNEDPEPVTGLRSGVPMDLERIINKCFEKDSGDRYQQINDLIVDLRKVERELSSGVRSKTALSDREEIPQTSSADKNSSSRIRPVKQKLKPWVYGIPVILILLLVLFFYLPDSTPPRETEVAGPVEPIAAQPESSIGVLPFVNMSPDPENEFFADGISEELLNVLAGIEGLTVASRTSAFLFKDANIPIPEIAAQLGVRHVVEGSVRRQADRVRITAQLVDADGGTQLWSDTYERDLTDIFRVQEEIAQAITNELEDILGTRRVVVEASTDDLDAYDRFLRGRARFHERTEFLEAIADLEYAVKHDPEFGEAWVYLAAVNYVAPAYLTELSYDDAIPAIQDALEHAGALKPDHPIGFSLRGQLKWFEGDWLSALRLLNRGAGIRSQHSTPALWYGIMLLRAGYTDEAIIALERAHLKDPLVAINSAWLGLAYLAAGRVDNAEIQIRLAAERGWIGGMRMFVWELAVSGEHERSIENWLGWITPDGLSEDVKLWFEALHDPAQTEAALESLVETIPQPYPIPGLIGLGKEDVYLAYARQHVNSVRYREDFWLRSIWLPPYAGVREHPKFFEIAADIGLVKLWEERGYPPGCMRSSSPEGDHLVCPEIQP